MSLIKDVPDFPQKGIIFKDFGKVFGDYKAVETMVDLMISKI